MKAAGSVIDLSIRHGWVRPGQIAEYMSAGWQEYIAENLSPAWRAYEANPDPSGPLPGGRSAVNPSHPYPPLETPVGRGDDVEVLAEQHLDAHGITTGVLSHDAGLMVVALPHAQFALELTRAANDWTEERWLAQDDRLRAAILVPNAVPELAAREIRRRAENAAFVAVALGANALGKQLGHLVYHPIYEAAAEAGLPVILESGPDAVFDLLAPTTSGGDPATFTDYYALRPQMQMSHVASLICQGVFERFPELKVVLTGAGSTWLIPYLWRSDTNYQGIRTEAPWMTKLPSEYFRRHFRVTTYPLSHVPTATQLEQYYGAFPGFEDLLCYASGFPSWDSVTPAMARDTLPATWPDKVLSENAAAFFGRSLAPVLEH